MYSSWKTSMLLVLVILPAIFATPGEESGQRDKQPLRPNILFIMADDLGYNDISFHNPSVHTPYLDTLRQAGVTLTQAYVQPMCTPTRSALLTGLYPYRYGRQGQPLSANSPTGLTLEHRLLPEYLQDIGYKTHMIGKWHLGFCKEEYLPTRRGFDSFQGFWSAYEDYTTKMAKKFNFTGAGYDFHYNEDSDESASGVYSADLYAQRAENVIKNHVDSVVEDPLFLYLAYQSPHSPVSAPQEFEELYSDIENSDRRLTLAAVSAMDASIGSVVTSLKTHGIFNNTVIVFTSDNGGELSVGGNNWPLRGEKATVWEGGVRSPTVFLAPNTIPGSTVNSLVHVTDWLPTLLTAAGQSKTAVDSLALDGVNQWEKLTNPSKDLEPRQDIVINLNDDELGRTTAGYRKGDYKVVINPGSMTGWVPPPVKKVPTEESDLENLNPNQRNVCKTEVNRDVIGEERDNCDVFGDIMADKDVVDGSDSDKKIEDELFLFNIADDPNERNNLAEELPDLLAEMMATVIELKSDMVTNDNPPTVDEGIVDGVWITGWC